MISTNKTITILGVEYAPVNRAIDHITGKAETTWMVPSSVARKAVEHVSYANYAEREREALGWIREWEREVAQPPVQRKLMTKEEMVHLIARTFNSVGRVDRESLACALVRAVERYYGIGGEA
jgi:DNA transposition AAA+ family ATPase